MQTLGEREPAVGGADRARRHVHVGPRRRIVLPRLFRKPVRTFNRVISGGFSLSRKASFRLGAGLLLTIAGTGFLTAEPGDGVLAKIAPAIGMAVSYYDMSGNHEVADTDIVALLADEHGDATLFYDVRTARSKLLAHPWIAEASVSKIYPNRLAIRLTEHMPFALWQSAEGVKMIDREGRVLADFDGRKNDLPLIVGENAAVDAASMIREVFAQPLLEDRIRALVKVGGRRWDIELKDGLVIMLPEGNPATAMRYFVNLENQHGLLARDIHRVDMRIAGRVIVSLGQHAAETVAMQREGQIKSIARSGRERDI